MRLELWITKAQIISTEAHKNKINIISAIDTKDFSFIVSSIYHKYIREKKSPY